MADFSLTHSGVSDTEYATPLPYGKPHLTDFMDIWPTKGPAVGIDHLFYEDGDVELRIMGDTIEELMQRFDNGS